MKNCQPDSARPKTSRSLGKTVSAIRAFYEQTTGAPVPDGWRVERTCDTPDCFNPDHITLVPVARRHPKPQDKIRVWAYLTPEEFAHLENNLTAPSIGGTIRKALGLKARPTDQEDYSDPD